jgi:hypothetical protein
MGLFSSKRDENGDRELDGLGQPLDEAGKRFFRQRESGYKGWIDQDGYRTDKDGNRIGGDL